MQQQKKKKKKKKRERERGKKEIFLPGLFFLSFFLFGSGRFFLGGGAVTYQTSSASYISSSVLTARDSTPGAIAPCGG